MTTRPSCGSGRGAQNLDSADIRVGGNTSAILDNDNEDDEDEGNDEPDPEQAEKTRVFRSPGVRLEARNSGFTSKPNL